MSTLESLQKDNNSKNLCKQYTSWRTFSYFKNSGIMFRFVLPRQLIYISFIKKTSMQSYQSFTDGFVLKIDINALNELLFCLNELNNPVQWDSWREKNGNKYQIKVSPFKIENFKLNSKSVINLPSYAFKFSITSNKDIIHQIILSNHEMKFILDLFTEFRLNVIQQICKSIAP